MSVVLSISTCLQYPPALILSCFSIAFFAGETDNFVKVLQNHRSIKLYSNFDYWHRGRQYIIIF